MPKMKESLIGKVFWFWTVTKEADTRHGNKYWLCKCVCGVEKYIATHHLNSGGSKSCGCRRTELCLQNKTTSPRPRKKTAHIMYGTRIYSTWSNMWSRCRNPRVDSYEYYGAKGISVCDRWKKFDNFYEDMKDGYADHLTIERNDNLLDYSKENCRWATNKEQANHKTCNIVINVDGVEHTLKQWSEIYGLSYKALWQRYKKYGYGIDRLFEPIMKIKQKGRQKGSAP